MKQVKDMFEQVTMPEEVQRKIRKSMKHPKKPASMLWKRAAAAAAMLILVIFLSPTVRAVVNQWAVKYFWPDSDITIYEMTDENGNTVGVAGVDTEAPAFARMVNGRLYFLGNGEKLDITDQISEEAPYFYTYVDDYGLTHYMAVGCSESLENFGIYEFIRDEAKGEWITGTGRNFLSSETETRYPWVDIVWEHYGIPWPMPE